MVLEEILPPRVQNADETDLRTQPLGIGRHFEHGVRAGPEK